MTETTIQSVQRNNLDVALELTQWHLEKYGVHHEDQIAQTYAKYFALMEVLETADYDQLLEFLPNEIKQKLV
ncbi:hypothetical protein [Bacillus sp. NPDC077027]|uniref:hypothetical protein n=1 Tax=Bacillus sp. NPDC077027 TaxID=3390548 RepID=UPI003D0496A5